MEDAEEEDDGPVGMMLNKGMPSLIGIMTIAVRVGTLIGRESNILLLFFTISSRTWISFKVIAPEVIEEIKETDHQEQKSFKPPYWITKTFLSEEERVVFGFGWCFFNWWTKGEGLKVSTTSCVHEEVTLGIMWQAIINHINGKIPLPWWVTPIHLFESSDNLSTYSLCPIQHSN